MVDKNFSLLEKNLGYQFKNHQLLLQALTHCSVPGHNNERLEFLGDCILNFIMGSLLFERFQKAPEGDLTRMRSRLVRGETLAEIARRFSLGQFIRLGIGEQKSGGFDRTSILSDAMEAIMGAIYLDSDIETCKTKILEWYDVYLVDSLLSHAPLKDAKTKLQEYLQSKGLPLPEYKVGAIQGAPHDQEFKIECTISLFAEPAMGIAKSRRKAEQMAAELMLERLKNVKKNG